VIFDQKSVGTLAGVPIPASGSGLGFAQLRHFSFRFRYRTGSGVKRCAYLLSSADKAISMMSKY